MLEFWKHGMPGSQFCESRLRFRLFLCGSLWPSVVHAFDLRLGFRLNDFDDGSDEKPNPSALRTGLG
jgi:hypothetical protein